MSKIIMMSSLPKTWFLDLDGTILKHNGYKIDGRDTFLDGALDFLRSIPTEDCIVFATSREKAYAEQTEMFLTENGVRWDHIIYELPYGERILVNDRKPSGLEMAIAVSTDRDAFMEETFEVSELL